MYFRFPPYILYFGKQKIKILQNKSKKQTNKR